MPQDYFWAPTYLPFWLVFALALVAGIGLERLFIDVVHFVDRRMRRREKQKPSPIVKP